MERALIRPQNIAPLLRVCDASGLPAVRSGSFVQRAQGGVQGAELGLDFGQFLLRIGTGDDASPGLQERLLAVEQRGAQGYRELAVTFRGEDAEAAAVPGVALFAMSGEPGVGGCTGEATDGGRWVQHADEIEEAAST